MNADAPLKKTVLVGWSGADWSVANPLIEQGHMPQLENIINHGCMGNLNSFQPLLSPMLWNTVLTGKHPDKHGILTPFEWDEATQQVQSISSGARSCSTIWDILTQQNIPAHAVGWSATHPAEPVNGYCISDGFQSAIPHRSGPAVFPPEKEQIIRQVQLSPQDVDPELLGLLIPEMDQLDPKRHGQHIHKLRQHLAELYSYHNAAIQIYATQPQGLFSICYRFIESVSRDFMHFCSPAQASLSAEETELFKEVVNGAYRLQDLLLADLLKYAQQPTSLFLVSEHGRFIPPQAGANTSHHPLGMLAAVGPGIQKDHLVHGAVAADIVPTLLHHMRLPVGQDMDGRVLTELFSATAQPAFIPSWEDKTEHAPTVEPDLGEPQREERCRNLGMALLALKRPQGALPNLEEAFFYWPENAQTAFQLVQCQIQLGLFPEAEQTLNALDDLGPQAPATPQLHAEIAYQRGEYAQALQLLETVLPKLKPRMLEQRGLVMLKLERFEEAHACFSQAAELNPKNALAWLGVARAHLRCQQYAGADEAAQQALALQHEMPLAHLTLGQSREALGDFDAALTSYALALLFLPELITARDGIQRCKLKQHPANATKRVRIAPGAAFSHHEAEQAMKADQQKAANVLRKASAQRLQLLEEKRTLTRSRHTSDTLLCSAFAGTSMIIRAPWPDEQPRLHALLKNGKPSDGAQHIVAVASSPERIVAVGTLLPQQTAEGTAYTCQIDILPRFQTSELPQRLLEALEQLEPAGTHFSLSFSQETASWMAPAATKQGYNLKQQVELWKGPIASMLQRVEQTRPRLEQRMAKKGIHFETVPLKDADPREIEQLVVASGLLSIDRIFIENENGHRKLLHHDSLSCLIRLEDKPVGIALVIEHGTKEILFDVRAVAPSSKAISALVNFHILAYVGTQSIEQGYEDVLFFSSDRDWRETRSMAERGHYRSIKQQQNWAKLAPNML
jgi:tetratricopeptide (TPR) repeat protein